MLFSIVIPTHHPDKQLFSDCLKSLYSQSFDDFEIIIVANNCSKEEISFIKERINKETKLFITSDIGVSRARNLGISYSKGDYIVFVDDDDLLNCCMLKAACNVLKSSKPDLIIFKNCFNKDKIGKEINSFVTLSSNDIRNSFYGFENSYGIETRSIWSKVFKAQIIKKNNISFNENLFNGEDVCFALEYSFFVKSACFFNGIDEYGYFYRQRNDSVSYKFNKDIISQFDIFNDEYSRILNDRCLRNEKLLYIICNQNIYNIFHAFIYNKQSNLSLVESYKELKKLFRKPLYSAAIKKTKISYLCSFKKKIVVILVRFHFYFILNVFLKIKYN